MATQGKSTALTQVYEAPLYFKSVFTCPTKSNIHKAYLIRANNNFVHPVQDISHRVLLQNNTNHTRIVQSHLPCTFFRGRARGGAEELLYGGDLTGLLVGFLLLKLGEGGERGLRVGLWRLSLRGTVTADISRLLFSLQPVTGNTSLRHSV